MKKSWILLLFFLTGCASLKRMIGMEKEAPSTVAPVVVDERVKFSETPSNPSVSHRDYRRMTRSRLEEESELQAQAGSMWVMGGQGAYLFAQNKVRNEGDLLNVRVEGVAEKQIQTKIGIIKKLLKQLEEQEKIELAKAQEAAQRDPASTPTPPAAVAVAKPTAEPADKKEKEEPIDLSVVPTRITEKTTDGYYRVHGQQPFMIGGKEYKAIVTGMIRSEDFNDEGVSSAKLIDAQYDVVSLRRKIQ